jgi:phosphatidylserine decarboxylase
MLETEIGEVIVRQISSIWTRRVITYPKIGEHVRIGQRLGCIVFGSTAVLELPSPVKILVEPLPLGRKRKMTDKSILAGETIVATY